jgi:hypothetical protein
MKHAATLIALTLAEAIRELGEVPSGHLYARVMDRLSLADYTAIISALKGARLISESHNLLTWKGPAL